MGVRGTVRRLQFDIAVLLIADRMNKQGSMTDTERDEINNRVAAIHESYCEQYLPKNRIAQKARHFTSLSAYKKYIGI